MGPCGTFAFGWSIDATGTPRKDKAEGERNNESVEERRA